MGLTPEEIARRVTGLIEVDEGMALGALANGGARGAGGLIFARYLAAYIMVDRFNLQVEHVARLLRRERGTVTKAIKVFRWLEGYQTWRAALESISNLCVQFVEYGERKKHAQQAIPAPVGRAKRNEKTPAWVRDAYARDLEIMGEAKLAREARERAESDSIYLRHPAVKALTDDPALQRIVGSMVVSVTLSPLDDPRSRTAVLLVPPSDKVGGAIALRLLMRGDSPSEIKIMMEAREAASRALSQRGYRLIGAAESFASRDREGWRYVPFHIVQIKPLSQAAAK